MSDVNEVFEKQNKCCPSLQRGNIIAYFAGVRASTYEEDFIIERSRKISNLIHVAGIQSPGLTAAPAFSVDVAEMTVELLKSRGETVEKNANYNPKRIAPVIAKNLEES